MAVLGAWVIQPVQLRGKIQWTASVATKQDLWIIVSKRMQVPKLGEKLFRV